MLNQEREKDIREKWLEQFMEETFSEQKKARRWGVVFKLLIFAYLMVTLIVFYSGLNGGSGASAVEPHTAVVRIEGAIASEEQASANSIVTGLRKAFENEHAKAVMLIINSPGGSPVQAGYVYDEILRLKALHEDKKVYAVIADLGASAAYYIAAAADEIYANRASLVGSIGVTASSFGFVDTLDKLGVERRHFTAGEHKSFLDPFSPLKKEEAVYWQGVLDGVHQQFIDVVKAGRGDKLVFDPALAPEEKDMFSGLVWNGEQALALGLVDGLNSPGSVARDVIGHEEIVDYTPRPSPFDVFTKGLGASIGQGIAQTLGLQGSQGQPVIR